MKFLKIIKQIYIRIHTTIYKRMVVNNEFKGMSNIFPDKKEFDKDFKMLKKIPADEKGDGLGIDEINMENMYVSEWFDIRHQFGVEYIFLRFRFKQMNEQTLEKLSFVLKHMFDFILPKEEIRKIKKNYDFTEFFVLKPIGFGRRNLPIEIKYRKM